MDEEEENFLTLFDRYAFHMMAMPLHLTADERSVLLRMIDCYEHHLGLSSYTDSRGAYRVDD